ncbi:MAG: hypothetical protein AAGA16_07590 [Cyanobacteria bacterium P01_E01_bin.35]
MSKRYKILDGAIKYLRTNNTDPNPQAPAGTPLRSYQEVVSGERSVTYARADESLPEEFIDVAVNPFGVAFDADNKYIVPISKRSNDFTGLSAARTAGHLITTLPANAKKAIGFEPAKAVVSVPDTTGVPQDATSQITGLAYVKQPKASYTFPYGTGAATDRVAEVRGEILAALPTNGNYSVTWKPEKI